MDWKLMKSRAQLSFWVVCVVTGCQSDSDALVSAPNPPGALWVVDNVRGMVEVQRPGGATQVEISKSDLSVSKQGPHFLELRAPGFTLQALWSGDAAVFPDDLNQWSDPLPPEALWRADPAPPEDGFGLRIDDVPVSGDVSLQAVIDDGQVRGSFSTQIDGSNFDGNFAARISVSCVPTGEGKDAGLGTPSFPEWCRAAAERIRSPSSGE